MLIKKLKDDMILIRQVSGELITKKSISTLFILLFVQVFLAILLDIYLKM